MKKKERFSLIIIIMILLFTGCQNAKELSELLIVSGVGIDRCTQGNEKLTLTAQIVLPAQMKSGSSGGDGGSSSGSGGGAAKPYFNLQNNGDTVLTALREMTQLINSKLYPAHNEVIIFGREIAESGIRAHLDFFIKDNEIRPITQIFVAEGNASDVLDSGDVSEIAPAINLKKLGETQKFNSLSTTVTLQEIANRLLSKTASPVVPIVRIEEVSGRSLQRIVGLAVFKPDKMIGKLNEKESRGLLFALNKVFYGMTQVTYKDQDVTLEIISASSKIQPQLNGQDIVFNISVKTKNNLMEQSGTEPLNTGKDLDELEELQRVVIQEEINLALEKAKSLKADFFGFGELLHKHYPSDWETMEDKWDEIFQTVKINITIDNQISDIGIAGKPLAPEKEQ